MQYTGSTFVTISVGLPNINAADANTKETILKIPTSCIHEIVSIMRLRIVRITAEIELAFRLI